MTMATDADLDAKLVALLDGALPASEARDLRARIDADPALQARLNALDVDMSGMHAAWDGMLAEAPKTAARAAPTGTLPRLAAAACVALALVLGGVLIGTRSDGSNADWRDFAAAYHLLYRPETLAAPMMGDGGVAVVSEAIGRDLSGLARIEGLDFRRAQVLGWGDATLVQFAYLDGSGRPIAVCVMDMATTEAQSGIVARHGLPTASFIEGSFEILVIGAEGTEGIVTLREAVASRL